MIVCFSIVRWVKSEAKKEGVDENIAKYDGEIFIPFLCIYICTYLHTYMVMNVLICMCTYVCTYVCRIYLLPTELFMYVCMYVSTMNSR